jgi:hypothetical protein
MLDNIHPQAIAVLLAEFLQAVNGGMCAFANTVGVTIGDEATVKNRFNQISKCVMYDAITKWCSGDFALFGFKYAEVMIVSGQIAEIT